MGGTTRQRATKRDDEEAFEHRSIAAALAHPVQETWNVLVFVKEGIHNNNSSSSSSSSSSSGVLVVVIIREMDDHCTTTTTTFHRFSSMFRQTEMKKKNI